MCTTAYTAYVITNHHNAFPWAFNFANHKPISEPVELKFGAFHLHMKRPRGVVASVRFYLKIGAADDCSIVYGSGALLTRTDYTPFDEHQVAAIKAWLDDVHHFGWVHESVEDRKWLNGELTWTVEWTNYRLSTSRQCFLGCRCHRGLVSEDMLPKKGWYYYYKVLFTGAQQELYAVTRGNAMCGTLQNFLTMAKRVHVGTRAMLLYFDYGRVQFKLNGTDVCLSNDGASEGDEDAVAFRNAMRVISQMEVDVARGCTVPEYLTSTRTPAASTPSPEHDYATCEF